MLIRHIGHAEFLIETGNGVRIVTDPYGEGCGYPVKKLRADAALVSHGHHDHNAVGSLEGLKKVVDREGIHTISPEIRVTALKAFHDSEEGKLRGETLLFLLETEGLRVVHLGDLGCELDEKQAKILNKPDILMIPVGGYYTIDGKTAARTAKRLRARIVLPMHYRTKYNADWPISGPEEFLAEIPEEDVRRDIEALRVTAADLECQPRAAIFKA